MFNVGPGEVIIVALVLLIAVGPEQLPGVIRRVGRAVSQVRSMTEGLRDDFMAGMDEIERASDPKTWAEDEASAPSKVKPPSNTIAAQNSSASLDAASKEKPAAEPADTENEDADVSAANPIADPGENGAGENGTDENGTGKNGAVEEVAGAPTDDDGEREESV